MDHEVYVLLFNGVGCRLSCEGFEDVNRAQCYIMDEILPWIETGDTIKVVAAEDM